MNHAERVKELKNLYCKFAMELHTADANFASKKLDAAIDAMQSALDDAVAKLAARDAEVERLRVAVKQAFMEGFYSPETYNDTVVNDANECWEKAKSLILGTNSHAALSEEGKGGA